MNPFDSLSKTLPPHHESAPVACRLLDLLPLCLEADDCFDLLLLSKLFFTRTDVTREQFLQAIEQRQRTGLSVEHLLVRNGHCDIKEALEVLSERRHLMRLILQDSAPWDISPEARH